MFSHSLALVAIAKKGGHDVSLTKQEATVSDTERVMLLASRRRRVTKVFERVPNVLLRPLCMMSSFMLRMRARVLGLYTSLIAYMTTYWTPVFWEHCRSCILSYDSSR